LQLHQVNARIDVGVSYYLVSGFKESTSIVAVISHISYFFVS
jgi:hypothetical protein